MATAVIIVTIFLYLSFVIAIGIKASKKNNDTDDFYLGGRKLGPFVTAMSAEASDMSSWLLMGLPGVAYLTGLADPAWTAIGLAVGTYLNWLIVAKKIRRYTVITESTTIPEFFTKRYRDKDSKNVLMAIGAIVIIVFFVPYTASGFAACGKLFASLFGVNYLPAMVISAIVIVAYTTLGGFLAASKSDFWQSIIMTIALIVVTFFGIKAAGGLDKVMENSKALAGYLSLTKMHNADGSTANYSFLTICSTMAWGLGYFGMPHILLRFMAIEDEKKLTLSRRVASVWVVISMAVSIFIGIIGYSVSKAGVIPMLSGSQSETVIIQISNIIAQKGFFFAIIAGLILAGILAATMSTADSQILAAASSVSENLVKGFFGIKLSQKKSMMVARLTVVGIAIIGVLLALNPDSSVFTIVSFAWAGFGAAFGPLMLFSLFWKRTNFYGAIAGMVSGGAMVFIWKFAIKPMGGVLGIYELLPAFLISSLFIVVVSLATEKPSQEIVNEFEAVKKAN